MPPLNVRGPPRWSCYRRSLKKERKQIRGRKLVASNADAVLGIQSRGPLRRDSKSCDSRERGRASRTKAVGVVLFFCFFCVLLRVRSFSRPSEPKECTGLGGGGGAQMCAGCTQSFSVFMRCAKWEQCTEQPRSRSGTRLCMVALDVLMGVLVVGV